MRRLLGIALGLALAFAAHAHTPLKASVPAADASGPAPKALELHVRRRRAPDVRVADRFRRSREAPRRRADGYREHVLSECS